MTSLKAPTAFLIIAIVGLIWNLMGVSAFIYDLFMDTSMASAEDLELLSRYPTWTKIPYAIAVFGGTLGALMLILKNKLAVPFFIFSLVGIIIQMGHSLFIAKALDVYGPTGIIMPIFVLLLGIFLLYYSKSAVAKGWIS